MPEGRKIFYTFVLWRTLLFLLIFIAPLLFTLQPILLGAKPNVIKRYPLLWVHGNFDGEHYISIAKKGYQLAEQAFFPLYPHLIRSLAPSVSFNYTLAGIFISNFSLLVALFYLLKLLKLDYKSDFSYLTILGILIFPASFFFGSVYTESLFFLLVILTFYFARVNKWWFAGIVGAMATATRFIGIFLFPALLLEAWQQLRDHKIKNPKEIVLKLLPVLIVPLGLILYMSYLNQTLGDPLAFIHSLPAYGQFRSEKIILLYQVFWRYTKMLLTVTRADHLYWTIVLEAVVGALFLITSIAAFRLVRLSYSAFSLAAYLVPTLTGSFVSLPRYVLVCFPSFIVIAHYLKKRPKVLKAYFFVSSIALIYFWMKFTRGYWAG